MGGGRRRRLAGNLPIVRVDGFLGSKNEIKIIMIIIKMINKYKKMGGIKMKKMRTEGRRHQTTGSDDGVGCGCGHWDEP